MKKRETTITQAHFTFTFSNYELDLDKLDAETGALATSIHEFLGAVNSNSFDCATRKSYKMLMFHARAPIHNPLGWR
jgi:hypothetical protein